MGDIEVKSEVLPWQLVQDLWQQQQQGHYVDLTLAFSCGTTCSVHKCVMSAVSKYLKSMIDEVEDTAKSIVLNEMSYSGFQPLLCYMYTGTLCLRERNSVEVQRAAEILELGEAITLCKTQLKMRNPVQLSPSDCVETSVDLQINEVTEICTEIALSTQSQEPTESCSRKRGRIKRRHQSDIMHKYSAVTEGEAPDIDDPGPGLSHLASSHEPVARHAKRGRARKIKETVKNKQTSEKKATKTKRAKNKKLCEGTRRSRRKSARSGVGLRECEEKAAVDSVNKFSPTHHCNFCPHKYLHFSSLKFHLRKHSWTHQALHTYRKSVNKAKSTLTIPLDARSVPKTKHFECKLCPSYFKLSSKYRFHMKMKHGQRVSCRQCLKYFSSLKLLKIHRLKVGRCKMKIPKSRNQGHFKCKLCRRIFLYKENLSSHVTHLHPVAPNKRGKVYSRETGRRRGYSSVYDMNTHVESADGHKINPKRRVTAARIRCAEEGCGTAWEEMKGLRRHVAAAHPQACYDCSRCKYKGNIKHLFERHVETVHGDKCEFRCGECNKPFTMRSHLVRHEHKHHGVVLPGLKLLPCDECKYVAYTNHMLKLHKKKHETEKKYHCEICGKLFKRPLNVEKHCQKVHLGIKPYVCETCGRSFAEEAQLKLHRLSHTDTYAYQCQLCDYKTNSKSAYQNHLYVKHRIKEGRFQNMNQCEICGYETDKPFKFKDHMNRHDDVRSYKCPHCDKAFFTHTVMRDHVKWVHTERTLKCQYCAFMAPTPHHLKEHVRIVHTHRDVKPYKCSYCDYRCKVSGNCRKHIMTKHKGMEVKWIKVCDKFPADHTPTEPVLDGQSPFGRPLSSRNNKFVRKDGTTKTVKSSAKPREHPLAKPETHTIQNKREVKQTYSSGRPGKNTRYSITESFIMNEDGVVESHLEKRPVEGLPLS